MAAVLVNEGGAFAPTRKYHLIEMPPLVEGVRYQPALRLPALCGAMPSCSWNHRVEDRAEFQRLVPERICKRCRRLDESTPMSKEPRRQRREALSAVES